MNVNGYSSRNKYYQMAVSFNEISANHCETRSNIHNHFQQIQYHPYLISLEIHFSVFHLSILWMNWNQLQQKGNVRSHNRSQQKYFLANKILIWSSRNLRFINGFTSGWNILSFLKRVLFILRQPMIPFVAFTIIITNQIITN